jgi:hypothetical protein
MAISLEAHAELGRDQEGADHTVVCLADVGELQPGRQAELREPGSQAEVQADVVADVAAKDVG